MISPAYLAAGSLGETLTLEAGLPQTVLPFTSQLVVGTFVLDEGWTADVTWLSLHWVSLATLMVPTKVTGAFGLAFVGLFHEIQGLDRYTGQPLVYATRDVPGYADANPYGHHVLSEPGHYTVLAVNNTSNIDLQLTATFAAKLYTQ